MEKLQWYPGHMTKAFRQMKEDLKLIDLVIEICDARIPRSSRNPEIDKTVSGKSRVVILNKEDLADPSATKSWIKSFEEAGLFATSIDGRNRKDARSINGVIEAASKEKRERDKKRGILNRPIRAMVVGIPNSGKSTFINSYAGKAAAKTGNRPGVTKGKQWIRLNKQLELLDTPGVLWPKFEDEIVGLHLAAVAAIKDDIFEKTNLVTALIEDFESLYPGMVAQFYGIDVAKPEQMLLSVCDRRNLLKAGGEADYDKAAALVLDDFRKGRLGRISLEKA